MSSAFLLGVLHHAMVVAADAVAAEVIAVVAAAVMVVAAVVDHCTLEPVLQDRGRSQKSFFADGFQTPGNSCQNI